MYAIRWIVNTLMLASMQRCAWVKVKWPRMKRPRYWIRHLDCRTEYFLRRYVNQSCEQNVAKPEEQAKLSTGSKQCPYPWLPHRRNYLDKTTDKFPSLENHSCCLCDPPVSTGGYGQFKTEYTCEPYCGRKWQFRRKRGMGGKYYVCVWRFTRHFER